MADPSWAAAQLYDQSPVGQDVSAWLAYQVQQAPGDPRHGVPLSGEQPSSGGWGDLWNWLNSPLSPPGQQAPGQQPKQQAQAKPPTNLAGLKLPPGADSATVQAVIRAAIDTGVDPALALSIAMRESGLTNVQLADGSGYGPFQLNANGGEGTGMSQQALNDPYQSSLVALRQIAQVKSQHPDWSAGQIAYAAQRPAEQYQGVYTNDINSYFDQITTGIGALGGLSPAAAGRAQSGRLPGATNGVPLPFASNYFFQDRTEVFHQTPGEYGNDYAMPVGQQIVTPVGGTIRTEDDGKSNWGKRVFVQTPSGWTFAVGHMNGFTVQDGQTVSAGSVLGLSGGDPADPSSGQSTGPHVEVQFIDPSGQYVDPLPLLQQLYNGTTYQQWAGGIFESSTQVQGQAQSLKVTPDHQLIDLNTAEGQWYSTVDNQWTSVFGQHAPLAAADAFRAGGVTSVEQLQNAINGLPGPVAGYSIGQYQAMDQAAQQMAQARFGRPVPQSLVADFLRQGMSTTSRGTMLGPTIPGQVSQGPVSDIQMWFDTHSSSDIPPAEYQQVFDAAQGFTQSTWSDYPHPTDVANAWSAAGGGA